MFEHIIEGFMAVELSVSLATIHILQTLNADKEKISFWRMFALFIMFALAFHWVTK